MSEKGQEKQTSLVVPIGVIITLLMGIFGYTFTCISNVERKLANSETNIEKVKTDLSDRIDDSQKGFTEIKTQLSQIQTDLLWIKKELNTKK